MTKGDVGPGDVIELAVILLHDSLIRRTHEIYLH